MAKDDNATCFTCKLGKTNCSFVKVTDGQVKIVRKKVKKPQEKQDVTMADVSEGQKEELAVDDEMTEVSQSKGKDLDMERGAKVDIEMAEAEVMLRKPVTIVQPDKGKGRENPAIILEPPTLVKGLNGTKATMDIGTNTNCLPISLPQAQKGSKSPGPILLAPNPVVATRARSASPHPIGSRKSPRLLEKEVSAALPSSKSPAL